MLNRQLPDSSSEILAAVAKQRFQSGPKPDGRITARAQAIVAKADQLRGQGVICPYTIEGETVWWDTMAAIRASLTAAGYKADFRPLRKQISARIMHRIVITSWSKPAA